MPWMESSHKLIQEFTGVPAAASSEEISALISVSQLSDLIDELIISHSRLLKLSSLVVVMVETKYVLCI